MDTLYSPGSKGTTLDSVTPFLDRTQLALPCFDTDDRTTPYGNNQPSEMKCSPKGSTHSQFYSGSESIEDHNRESGGERNSWIDESYMTWTNTAMHLLKSGESQSFSAITIMHLLVFILLLIPIGYDPIVPQVILRPCEYPNGAMQLIRNLLSLKRIHVYHEHHLVPMMWTFAIKSNGTKKAQSVRRGDLMLPCIDLYP